MHAQRCGGLFAGFTATLLENGMVLVAGGLDLNGLVFTVELYDPSTGTFSVTGSLNRPRSGHTATLLPNGEVLIAGGLAANYLASAELYNPATGTCTFTGRMQTIRELFTATPLDTGEVLVAGGQNSNLIFPFLTGAELYNPAAGTFKPTGGLNNGRYFYTATLLNNGRVLIAAGAGALNSAELYDPTRVRFSVTGSLNIRGTDRSAVLLQNEEAMAVGGYNGNGGNIGYLSSAELFHCSKSPICGSPPYRPRSG